MGFPADAPIVDTQLSLERIRAELPRVPFADHVWPKFLHQNACRVLGLPGIG